MILRSKISQPDEFIFRAIALKKRLHRRGMIIRAGIEARLMIREEKFTTYYSLLILHHPIMRQRQKNNPTLAVKLQRWD